MPYNMCVPLALQSQATAEALAPTQVSGLAFRNKQLVTAMGQTMVPINVYRGNCCNSQVVARQTSKWHYWISLPRSAEEEQGVQQYLSCRLHYHTTDKPSDLKDL